MARRYHRSTESAPARGDPVVDLHGRNRIRLGRCLTDHRAFSLWNARGGLLPEPDKSLHDLAPSRRAHSCPSSDMAECALGGSVYTAARNLGHSLDFVAQGVPAVRCSRPDLGLLIPRPLSQAI